MTRQTMHKGKDYLYIGNIGFNLLDDTTEAHVVRCLRCGDILEQTGNFTATCSCRGYGWDRKHMEVKLTPEKIELEKTKGVESHD